MLEQDENENGSHIFQMHENFRLIATQNPNNDSFLGKREELPKKLLQEFNIIDFPSLFKNELKYIVKEIANNNNYKNLDLIDKILNYIMIGVNQMNLKLVPNYLL
jgi:midasin (ATPase involved in ribosome maturation)